MNSLTHSEKTFSLIDQIDAQAHFINLRQHNFIVRELEELIGEAYRSGNETMENRYGISQLRAARILRLTMTLHGLFAISTDFQNRFIYTAKRGLPTSASRKEAKHHDPTD